MTKGKLKKNEPEKKRLEVQDVGEKRDPPPQAPIGRRQAVGGRRWNWADQPLSFTSGRASGPFYNHGLGNSPSSRPDPYLRIHAVNVYVRDQDEALRFYTEAL